GFQCERIQSLPQMAQAEGVPLVINARTDVYLPRVTLAENERFDQALQRAKAYLEAGADCFYPIMLGDLETLKKLYEAIRAPINVFAPTCRATLRELEDVGIARLSLGPGLMRASLTRMRKIAVELQNYGSFDSFTRDMITNDEIRAYLSKEPMQ
ncbi:MAG: isocitrate lyase/phosphoenolpyruvate mutase family protein, partial [Deltaproteobacteria bacterium]|nr:isocitrate lyase/phosphoenolpyruvate mutase family protein [Deltaproteobacteria bacterium]